MKRIPLLCLCCFSLLTACAPLQPHSSAWGDAGEVAWRVPLGLVTLGLSEFELNMRHARAEREEAYRIWYAGLSAQEREREDRRDAARLQALGFALMGGGLFQPAPQIAPLPSPSVTILPPLPVVTPRPMRRTCSAVPSGTMTIVDCY